MDDRNDAPTGATAPLSPLEWPAADASTLEWARFYRDRLGFVDLLPTPSETDRFKHARYLAQQFEDTWLETHHGQAPTVAMRGQWVADGETLAFAVRGPIPLICAQHRGRTATDADLVRWFTPMKGKDAVWTKYHLERGVCVHLGGPRDRLVQTDVDPRHGGDVRGELAAAPGLRVTTPRGGVHVFTSGPAHHSDGALGPGVEVRTSGWAVLPCGAATPGRAWADVADGLVAPHPRLQVPPPRVERKRPLNAALVGADGRPPPGRVATILLSEHSRGDGRTQSAGAIVGLLARHEGLPADAVDAIAALLVGYGAGLDWSTDRTREEVTRWRALATRGPRDAEFAAEVLQTWVAVRTDGSGGKGAAWARATAWSLWKTADRREEGQAGAEDLGHVGAVEDYAAPLAEPPPAGPAVGETSAAEVAAALANPPPSAPAAAPPVAASTAEVRASDYVIHGPYCTCGECQVAKVEAKDADAVKRGAFLRKILPFSADAYPDDVADRDMDRVPLRIDALFPFWNFWGVCEEKPDEGAWDGVVPGHGYGRHLARAVGGLLPGSMVVVGGAGAKIGKTYLVGQAVEGLALDAAARILGLPGYQDKPIVMVTWITEMPKPGEVKYRMLSRLFGFDAAALASSAAPEAPGIIHMAERATAQTGRPVTPVLVVQHARNIVRAYRSADRTPDGGANPVAFYLKYLQTEVALSAFPAPTGQGRSFVDQASGVNLVGHVADGVMLRRRELAERIGVAEDKITPIVVIDPGQRFIGGGESSKRELDAFLLAVQARLCFAANGVGAVVLMTSDTTKEAVKDVDLDTFLSDDAGRLAARIFAGSQAWMHIPDTVLAVASQESPVAYRRTQTVRVLMTRNGAQDRLAYPFEWETFCGRFRPKTPVPLRDPSEVEAERGQRSRGGGRQWAPPGQVGDHDQPPAKLPQYKQNGGRQHYGRSDD